MRQAGKHRRKAGTTATARLAFIENAGPDNVREVLRAELKDAREVCIAVAFVTRDGLDQILQSLRSVAAQGSVRFLTGLYQHFTQPSALRALLAIQQQTAGRLSVRLSKGPQFHRKLYLIRNKARAAIVVGSSNLTKEGFRSGGELNALLRLPVESTGYLEAYRIFNDDWKYACDLNKGQIQRYERKGPWKSGSPAYTSADLNEILRTKAEHHAAFSPHSESTTWRTAVTFEASKRSEQIVSESTNWDDRGYNWWVEGRKSPCRQGGKVCLFDCVSNCLLLVQVMDFADPKVRNADGTHFVAYKWVPRYRRRLTPKLWRELKAIGISKVSARDSRRILKVGPSLSEELKALIRRSRS